MAVDQLPGLRGESRAATWRDESKRLADDVAQSLSAQTASANQAVEAT